MRDLNPALVPADTHQAAVVRPHDHSVGEHANTERRAVEDDLELQRLPVRRKMRMEMQVLAMELEARDAVDECVPHAAHRGDVEAFVSSPFAIVEVDRGRPA